MDEDIWLTTYDNPFDPFTQWDKWYDWDMRWGHNTCGKIADEFPAKTENLTEMEEDKLTELAIRKVFEDYYYPTPKYRIVHPGELVRW